MFGCLSCRQVDVANNARQLVETLQPEVLAASKESAKAIVQFSSTITTTISGAVTTGSLPDVDLQVGEIFHKTLAASQSLSGWFDNVAPIAADFVKGAFGVIEHVPLIGFAGRILGMMQQTVQGALVNKEECRKLIECVDSLRAPLAKYERLLTTDEERELIQQALRLMFEAACFVKLCQQRNVVFETLSTESHRKKLVDFNRSFESLVQRLTFQSSVQTLEVVKDISADLQMGNDTVARLAHKLGVKSGEDRNGVHNLPFRPRDSEVSSGQDAARKEVLQSIASALINTDCVCLYGENGSGKSHLASQYAYESLRATDGFGRYRQILWVNASRPQRLRSYASLSSLLDLPVTDRKKTLQESVQDVKAALEGTFAKERLLILDGIDSPDSLGLLMPKEGTVKVILTTARPELAVHTKIKVSGLSADEISSLLQGEPSSGSPQGLTEGSKIAADLLGLPLIAVRALAELTKRGLAASEVLAALRQHQTGEEMLKAALDLVWDRLHQYYGTCLPDEKASWAFCSRMILAAGFLSPSRVPFDLLYASARVIPTPDNFPGTNTAEGAKVRQDAQQEKEQKETVKNLAMKHLMSFGIFEELAEEDCYTVHELVQVWARGKAGPEVAASVIRAVVENSKSSPASGVEHLAALWSHRESWLTYKACKEELLLLAPVLSQALVDCGDYAAAQTVCSEALKLCEHGTETEFLLKLRLLQAHEGDHSCQMRDMRELVSEIASHKGMFTARGSTLVRAGFYREAFDHFKDAMHFVARYFRDGRDLAPSIYTGFTEVGQACLKQGLHHELVAMYDKVLKGEDGQLLAQDDARVLQMRRLYAIAYLDGQEYDKAIDVLKGLVETLVCGQVITELDWQELYDFMVRAAHGKGAPDLADQFRQEKADVRSLLDEAAQKPAHEQTAHRQKLSELLKAKRSQVGESLKKGTAALGLEAAKISSQVGDGVKAMGALIGGAVHDMGEWKGALGAKLMHFGVGAKQAATAEAPK